MFNKENQSNIVNSESKEKKQTNAWPKAFNPFVSNQKTFPKSWSRFTLNASY